MASAGMYPSNQTHSSDEKNWNHFFSPEVENELLDEDRQAWRGVTGLLIAIVSTGVLLFASATFFFILR